MTRICPSGRGRAAAGCATNAASEWWRSASRLSAAAIASFTGAAQLNVKNVPKLLQSITVHIKTMGGKHIINPKGSIVRAGTDYLLYAAVNHLSSSIIIIHYVIRITSSTILRSLFIALHPTIDSLYQSHFVFRTKFYTQLTTSDCLFVICPVLSAKLFYFMYFLLKKGKKINIFITYMTPSGFSEAMV